jgi:hypothetical protein
MEKVGMVKKSINSEAIISLLSWAIFLNLKFFLLDFWLWEVWA